MLYRGVAGRKRPRLDTERAHVAVLATRAREEDVEDVHGGICLRP